MGRNSQIAGTLLLRLIIKKHQKPGNLHNLQLEDFCSGLCKPSWHTRARNDSSERFSVRSLAAGFMDDQNRGGDVCEEPRPASSVGFRVF